jgi:tight adherence protein B
MTLATIFMLTAGLLLVGGIGYLILRLVSRVLTTSEMRDRMQVYAVVTQPSLVREVRRGNPNLTRFRMRVNSFLSVLTSEELNVQLLSANWPITETEFILIKFWGSLGAFGLGWLASGSVIPGIGMGALAYMTPSILLKRAILKRRLQFENQLVDVLVLLTGAVQAGYSFQQALDFVIKEMKAPASDEFRRVKYEIGLGLPLNQALNNMTTRMQNDDLYLLVTAININAQVGGNMVNMMKAVTQTIRERVRLFGEVRVLTSQQRFNSYLLTFIPFGIAAVLFVINPEYISKVFEVSIWLCFPIGALISIILGNIILRKVSKIEV